METDSEMASLTPRMVLLVSTSCSTLAPPAVGFTTMRMFML
jgi:hypothetical protein